MVSALLHRGPDGWRTFGFGTAAMAHLLLSVDGTTPRPLSHHGTCLVIDGRIDNLDLLKRILGKAGVGPLEKTEEVVLAAYRHWGLRFPRWILGDFAMALWDSSCDRLLLVRDPVGVKSLYYHLDDHRIVFASEIKGVLAGPKIPRRPCGSVLEEYDRDLLRSRERTFFEGVKRVLPAEVVCAEKGRMSRWTYWHPRAAAPVEGIRQQSHLRRFRALFEEAVVCRLPRTGSAAVSLSGGLDSSSIASVAADAVRRGRSQSEIRALSVVIGPFPNERVFFEAVCDRWKLPGMVRDAASVPLGPHLRGLARELEMPFIDVIDANLYHDMCRSAADDGARVMLMGVWGDDLMAGLAYVGDLLRGGRLHALWNEWRAWSRLGLGRLSFRRALRFLLFPNPDGPLYSTCNQRELHTLIFRPYQGLVLESLDKGAAAQGIEIRLPFLDRRLIDFVFSIPSAARAHAGVGKRLIREGLRDLLPESVIQRKDKGEYTEFWHSKLREAGETGTWEEGMLAWKRRTKETWQKEWFTERT